MKIKFHGQSCFELSDGDATVVVDPFLKPNNPVAVHTADEVEATHVLLTHGHADHIADAVGLCKRTGAPAVAIVETAGWLGDQGVEETVRPEPRRHGRVRLGLREARPGLPHEHDARLGRERPSAPDTGTPVGQAAGLVITIGGKTIYHAGDTCLFGDMELIARRHPVDIAILPIGGHYTMDRHDAAFAAGLIGAATVIPCHYDTFPPIEADAEAFKADVEDQSSSEVVILAPGEEHDL